MPALNVIGQKDQEKIHTPYSAHILSLISPPSQDCSITHCFKNNIYIKAKSMMGHLIKMKKFKDMGKTMSKV